MLEEGKNSGAEQLTAGVRPEVLKRGNGDMDTLLLGIYYMCNRAEH